MPPPPSPPDRRAFLARLPGLAGVLGWTARARATQGSGRPGADEYDYVIVGAGSAGCVIAHRLSAKPHRRVLLLEAGGPAVDPRIARPGQWVSLLGSEVDWQFATVPQEGLGGRTIAWPRGRVVGGSSAINAMAFVRGHPGDFDRWRDEGNAGWGFADVLPLFKRSEDNSRGASAFHGAGGPLAVADTTDQAGAHLAFLESARRLGYDAAPEWDFNGPRQENAAGFYQKNIRDGRRHSAADAFLGPALDRPNLTARPWSRAVRVVWDGRRAAGVEYLRDGTPHLARAVREVILCGGAVDSPRLLMLSGVGPADTLRRLGLPVVADLPGVGENLQDHLRVTVVYRARRQIPGSTVSAGLFVHSSAAVRDTPPDLQFYFGRGLEEPSVTLAVTVALSRPTGRGVVRPMGPDPLAPPTIDPRYLESDDDVRPLVQGARLAREIARGSPFDPWRGEEMAPGNAATTHAQLAAFVRGAADTIFHPAGTCRMGTGRLAVVDASLRVRGVEGLRVADASVMPSVVNTMTHAACVMIGERAADLIGWR